MTAVFMQCSMAKEQKENYETAVVVICLVFTPRESTEVVIITTGNWYWGQKWLFPRDLPGELLLEK